ncbi:MAG: DUF2191 domain-containing protein [Candidatus Koribacter versatilis]|uniref:DUF2191 domain-containing protein n=1 Tax=Candidatus Korobacter versatilis TaxID=658062 RepID=A0A932A8V7_9BACT|nr:DUF2191 domain-containing protein [Candidatus Koribacter versatilis]
MKPARTTLTIDRDVLARMKAEMRRTGLSFKELANLVLRRGLSQLAEQPKEKKPFVIKARPLGERPGINYDKTSELLELGEGPWHR